VSTLDPTIPQKSGLRELSISFFSMQVKPVWPEWEARMAWTFEPVDKEGTRMVDSERNHNRWDIYAHAI